MKALAIVIPTLLSMRRRLLLLFGFAAVLLASAAATRLLAGGGEHVELDRLFDIGGPTLASAFLLFGWIVGRFPLIATLVLIAGVFSSDRESGLARIYLVRPIASIELYGVKFAALAVVAFLVSILVLPLFDLLLLGQWAGTATIVLAAAYVIAYGSVVALLSVWSRADAWIALMLGILALTWNTMRTVGALDAVPIGGRQFVTLVLPPHGALFALESAFGQIQPIPWNAFLDVCIYGMSLIVVAGLALRMRDV